MLKTKAAPVTDIDGKVVRLVDDMFDTLYDSDNGLALAAPQIGVQKQVVRVGPRRRPAWSIFNPEIVESDGEWVYEEGCLSIPGLYVEIVRPKQVLAARHRPRRQRGRVEADELEARMFQHELDHLNGVLMFDRMTPDQRKRGAGRVPPPASRAPSRRATAQRRRLRLR